MPSSNAVLRRLRAAGLHLAASAIVVGAVATLVFGVWYPGPLRDLSGGLTLFLILAGVDVTLGPLLTAVVFNPAKSLRELRIDLAVIVVVQLCALGYGVWTMAVARPVLLAFEVDLFRVVTAVDVVDEQLPEAPQTLRTLPWTGPRLIATARPDGTRTVEATMLGMSGIHLAMQPRYWVPFEGQRSDVVARSRPLGDLPEALRRRVPDDLQLWPGASLPPSAELRWLPVLSLRSSRTLFVDHKGQPVAVAPFDAP